ncbi:hypothetical protein POSPLADRAFT_1063757 [Postia placenta MAD-698-R-SB12]|uniref:Uncharacterized protein n=1 Tax=Postia placenta MAD-698-R-SB12 TaxID=670580 RepID=A0A1X6MH96_9APHY|nr:hypothetical protein POSPLADRAFT_1063757 [Postia placenta MAD-698-R-SB12]OSX55689.1 hypothetical protein POSPLADRAFT_1063757 [Postia placenta MAD-698-R-SB12]
MRRATTQDSPRPRSRSRSTSPGAAAVDGKAREDSVDAAARTAEDLRMPRASKVPSSLLCLPSNNQPHCASIQPPPLPVLQSSNQGANRPRRRTPSIDPTPPAPSNHAARTHNARAVESRRTHKRQQAESVRAASVPRRLTHSAASRPLNRRIVRRKRSATHALQRYSPGAHAITITSYSHALPAI